MRAAETCWKDTALALSARYGKEIPAEIRLGLPPERKRLLREVHVGRIVVGETEDP